MALDTNVPAILQVVVDPSGAEAGAAKVSAAIGKMTDTSLKFLQTMQNSVDGTFKNLSKTNSFSTLAASSRSSFDSIANSAKANFEKAATAVKAFWATFASESKKGIDKSSADQDSWFSGFKGKLLGLTAVVTAVFSVEAISSFISKLYEVNNVYNAFLASVSISTGSIESAKLEYQYLFNLAQSLGVEVAALTKSYTQFSAAVHGTALEGRGAKEIFEAISMASMVLHKNAHDTELMFYAITQSISKGRVSREELVRQLAEKLPRAFGLAATAMYPMMKNTEAMAQLNKDLTAGTIPMNEFFLKFSKILKTEYGPAAEIASQMIQASVNRMKNSIFQFFVQVGQSKAMEAFSSLAEMVSRVLDSSSTAASSFGEAIGGMVDKITLAVSMLSARDIDAMLRGVSGFINGLGLAFDVVATGLGGVKTEGSGFLNFMKSASDVVIIFSSAVTQLVNGLRLMGTYLFNKETHTMSNLLPWNGEKLMAEEARNAVLHAKTLADREKFLKNIENTEKATEDALLKNKQNFDRAMAENNKVSNNPFANSARPTRSSIGIPTDDELKAIYGSDPITQNAKALREEESAAKKLQGEYENLISRIKEKQELAAEQIDSTVKVTAAQKTEVKFMHDLNALNMSQKDDRYQLAAAMIHETKVLEDKAVAQLLEIANIKAYDAVVQFHLNNIGTKTEKTLEDIKSMELAIAVHGKTEDQLFATADARLADESAAYSEAAAIQTLNGAAEKDIKFLLDMATATDTLRAARKQLNDKRLELEVVKAAAETQKEWDKVFNSMEGQAHHMFMSIGSRGMSSWKDMLNGMKDLFRTTLLEYIYASFAKPFVIQLIGSVAGVFGASGLASAANSALNTSATGAGGTGVMGTLSSIKDLLGGVQGSLANSVASFGGWISSLGANGTGFLSDGLSSLGSSIQLGSKAIANALPYAGALLQLAQGNVKGAAFTAAGAAIGSFIPGVGTAIGAVAGSLLGGLFGGGGDKSPRLITSGTGSYANGQFTSGAYANAKGGNGTASNQAALQEAFAKTLGTLFKGFGLSDSIETSSMLYKKRGTGAGFGATFEGGSVSTVEWSKSGDLNAIFQRMVDTVMGPLIVQAIEKSNLSDSIKSLFDGLTDKTQVATMIQATIDLNMASDTLASSFGLTVDQAAKVAVATGAVGDALATMLGSIVTASGTTGTARMLVIARTNLLAMLDGAIPETLSGYDAIIKSIDKSNATGIAKVAQLLTTRAGFEQYTSAMDGLKGGVASATMGLRTPQAQSALLQDGLTKAFSALNLTVPKSNVELLALGDSIDYTTEAGLNLAMAFPDLAKAFAATQTQVDALSGSMNVTAENFATLLDFNRYKGVSANYGGAFAADYAYNLGSGAVNQKNDGSTTVVGGSNVVAEIQAMRAEMSAVMIAVATSNNQTANILKRWEGDGMPATRVLV